ncbi:hypothetical protein HHI36_010009 [Cryptolaemus montrouzieri]|uniref:Uncharacterized protein n=1 Tax=Cryptolaemus montrouzieri TaxID=559131 RepID=A0ABD2MHX1_9CUCU
MYTLIFFSILCGVFYPIDGQNQDSQAMMAKVTSVLQKCSEETGATPNVITKIKLKQPVTTRQEKCMLFCTYRELKLQTPDGEFSLDVAISNLRNVAIEDSKLLDKLVEVYTKCSKSKLGFTDSQKKSIMMKLTFTLNERLNIKCGSSL